MLKWNKGYQTLVSKSLWRLQYQVPEETFTNIPYDFLTGQKLGDMLVGYILIYIFWKYAFYTDGLLL